MKRFTHPQQSGFSLFELVVYLLLASILFSVVLNRYRDMPGEAERANVIAVLAQLKTSVNLQMMHAIATGNWQETGALAGSNPMDLMLETPFSYAGAFNNPDPDTIPLRSWYFNRNDGELVYIVENTENLTISGQPASAAGNLLRFRIRSVFEEDQTASPGAWQGLVLEPAVPYIWQAVTLDEAIAHTASPVP